VSAPQLGHQYHRDPRFLTTTLTPTDTRQRISIRQDAYLRRLLQRSEDLPRQGALQSCRRYWEGFVREETTALRIRHRTFDLFTSSNFVALRFAALRFDRIAAHNSSVIIDIFQKLILNL
jgi:hypothetical protein